MNNACWIVPTHEPRFDAFTTFVESFDHFCEGIDLVVVLSYQNEVALYEQYSEMNIKFIFLEDYFDDEDIELFIDCKSIVLVKKFLSMRIMAKEYEKLVVTDDETELLSKVSADLIMEYDNHHFYYHSINGYFLERFLSDPVRLLEKHDRNIIQENFVKPRLYNWFRDLPIYNGDQIDGMLSRFGLNENNWAVHVSFELFEHILYQYHIFIESPDDLQLYVYDWDPKYCGPTGNCWESGYADSFGIKYLKEDFENSKPLWVADSSLLKLCPSAIAVFHTDRNYRAFNLRLKRWIRTLLDRLGISI